MFKATLISVLTSTAVLIGTLFADGVVIDHNLPEKMNPGDKKIVSININKGEVTGFAKLQLEIPAGLTARHIKKSGASFTFSGQKAKFIWMTLPDQQSFTVEYELEANTNICGPQVITGQFSYIKENERIDYDIATKTIIVGDCGETVDSTESSNETTSQNSNSAAVCKRTVAEISSGKYYVTLSCESVLTDGFAKYIENTPNGYSIEEDKNGDAITTVENNQVKFVWFEKPSDGTFSVSYFLMGAANEQPEVQGQFSYVSQNSPHDIVIDNYFITNPKDMASSDTDETGDSPSTNTTESTDSSTTNSTSNNTTENSADNSTTEKTPDTAQNNTTDTNTSNTSENTSNQNTDNTSASASNVPDAENGINYKVQLAATHKYMTGAKFKVLYKFKGEVQLENHEGWTKYVTGSHEVYKDARDTRNSLTATYPKFKGPFVTAYNDGVRITVQEALMISKQKWYQ